MKRRFLGVFICLLSIFLMSHNSRAVDVVYSANIIDQRTINSTTSTSTYYRVYFNNLSVQVGDIVEMPVVFFPTTSNNNPDGYLTFDSMYCYTGDAARGVSAGYSVADSNSVGVVRGYSRITIAGTINNCIIYGKYNSMGDTNVNSSPVVLWRNTDLSTIHSDLSTISSYLSNIQSYSLTINNTTAEIRDILRRQETAQGQTNEKLDDLNDTITDQNEKENQSIDNIDNQSSSDIQGTEDANTTSLIGLFGSFVSALSSASATNCNIDGDLGNVDLGTLNLCRDDPPAIVQIIGSIFLIVLFVPLAYFLVKRIISEVRSFTNG